MREDRSWRAQVSSVVAHRRGTTAEDHAPWGVTILGGRLSACTLHFVMLIALALFTFAQVVMVTRAGFRRLMCAMISGGVEVPE